MGIRQLPSGSFQVRFQLDGTAHIATFPTREMAEEAEVLMRATALVGSHANTALDHADTRSRGEVVRPAPAADRAHGSSEAAAVIDAVFAGLSLDQTPSNDELLTTTQAAALLGVSRPTLIAWLEAGRIPFHRHGTHRRIRRSDVAAMVLQPHAATRSGD